MAHDHQIVKPSLGEPRPITITDLMAEADSYHRFWIEERGKRLMLETAILDLLKQPSVCVSDAEVTANIEARKRASAALSAARALLDAAPGTQPVVPNSVESKSEVVG